MASILIWASVLLTGLAFVALILVLLRRNDVTSSATRYGVILALAGVIVNGIAYNMYDRQEIGDLQWAANGGLQIAALLVLGAIFFASIAFHRARTKNQ